MSGAPHDSLIKAVFSNPEVAAAFFGAVLPDGPSGLPRLDLLRLEPGSFVVEQLAAQHTDLLFSCGDDALVYLLFEHKSWADPRLLVQLLGYVARIESKWLADHPDEKTVPAVISVVLYHGEQPWNVPRRHHECLRYLPGRDHQNTVPNFEPHLIDLSERSDEELFAIARQGLALVGLSLLALKHHGATDIGPRIESWRELFLGACAIERIAGAVMESTRVWNRRFVDFVCRGSFSWS